MFRVSRKLGVHIYNSHLWCELLGSRLEKCCNLSLLRNQELLHNLQHLVKLYRLGKCTYSASFQQGTGSYKSNLYFIEQIWLIGVCYTSTVKWVQNNLTGAVVKTVVSTHLPLVYSLLLCKGSKDFFFSVLTLKAVLYSTVGFCKAMNPHFYSLQEDSHIVFRKHFQFQVKTAKSLYDRTLLLPEVVARK